MTTTPTASEVKEFATIMDPLAFHLNELSKQDPDKSVEHAMNVAFAAITFARTMEDWSFHEFCEQMAQLTKEANQLEWMFDLYSKDFVFPAKAAVKKTTKAKRADAKAA